MIERREMKHSQAFMIYVIISRIFLVTCGGLMIWAAANENPLFTLFGGIAILVGLFGNADDF